MSLGVEKLIGPRHVWVELVTLSAANPGVATVTVNLPTTNTTDYVVQVYDQTPSSNGAITLTAWSISSTTNEATISLSGTTSHVAGVVISKVGYAGTFLADALH